METLHVGVPLSWEQQQVWLHAVQFPEQPLYTETPVIYYRGTLEMGALQQALHELSLRHDILRAVIQEQDGIPHFVVASPKSFDVEFFDLSKESDETRDGSIRASLAEYSKRPFSLGSGRLLRAQAIQCTPDDARIWLSLHHLVFDGPSLRQIILPELIELYESRVARKASLLTASGTQHAEYVQWQTLQADAKFDNALAFWRKTLEGASPTSVPTDRARHPQLSRKGSVHFFDFDAVSTQAVLGMSRRQRTTPFSILLTSFIALLGRYAETQDVMLGTVYGGRPNAEFENVVGCFINILLLRADLTGDPTFSELLSRVRSITLDALENSAAPFQEVVRQSLSSGDGNPPVQVVFHFQPQSPALSPAWDVDVFSGFNGCAKFDVHVEIEQKNGVFRGRVMYSSELFDRETIEGMVQHWLRLLRAAVDDPTQSIWKLPILDETERNWLIHEVNPAPAAVPQFCMHDLFVQKAQETPERIALQCQGQTFTYRELESWSASIAGQLLDRGIGSGSVVALMIERSPALLAGLLGILRAGAAYVPLDPTYPTARIEHMMQVAKADLLLTQHHLVPRLPVSHPVVLEVNEHSTHPDFAEATRAVTSLPAVQLSASAYILFTSGSTGVPKGIEIPHSALINLLWAMQQSPGITADDGLLAVTSISFDIAGLELLLPLITGARVKLATAEEAADPNLLMDKLAEASTTIMQATPATWRMLVDCGWKQTQPLKIMCGGEALPLGLAEELLRRSSSVWNVYGPTETTIWSSCVQLHQGAKSVPLGDPILNTQLYVLDSLQALTPTTVSGELYIGGEGLAKGYYGQPELTQERFPMVTLGEGEPRRLYRTGDRVRRLRDGSMQFLGRMDRQIKFNGFRIELGEIEAILNSLPGVREGAVVFTQLASRGSILAAYVVPAAGVTLTAAQLRAGLAKHLPHFMQPSAFRILEEFPLTLNGKLDRNRLPTIEAGEDTVPSAPPQNKIEEELATIWRDVLGLQTIGRSDNFFDLGGRSLEAVRSISRANGSFGSAITFAAFIQGPTVAQLARVIEKGAAPKIQFLKEGISKPKRLIWTGAEPWLHRFASHLSDDITFYAVTPDLDQLGECTIEAMATQILSDVKSLATEGPYLLGGFCLRSLLALEVARQLKAEGSEVGLLILGDLYSPGRRVQWTLSQRILRRMHRETWNVLNTFDLPRGRRLLELRRVLSSWKTLGKGQPDNPEISDDLLHALYEAELAYKPVPYADHVLFCESGESRLVGGGTLATWDGLLSDVEVLRYTGLHENQLNTSYLGAFAKRIDTAMEHALAAIKTEQSSNQFAETAA